MEDRNDLLAVLLFGLEAKQRNHVQRAMQMTTRRNYEDLREESVDASPSQI
jgi:hypothetical protein